jgi:hypothetical protein
MDWTMVEDGYGVKDPRECRRRATAAGKVRSGLWKCRMSVDRAQKSHQLTRA